MIDLIGATVGIVVFAPIAVVVAALIRVSMGSPVLYSQVRPGLNATPFRMWKFRTMSNAQSTSGELLSDAERLTPLGSFLRSTSIDELPELINVARGEMSLVGPRPLLMEYLDHYNDEESRRHDVRPGITGWAQINGRNALSWEDKFRLDVWYTDNGNLLLDFRILAMTVWAVVRRDGVNSESHATMPKFERPPPDSA